MKKFLLSFGLIIAFAFYSLISSTRSSTSQIAAVSNSSSTSQSIPPLAAGTNSTKTVVKIPKPVATATPAPVAIANTGKFKNGTYSGPAVDAYFGNVQVSAVIQGGALTDVQFLQYPNDRSNSIRINTRAIPILKSEAIQAQSASVNGVSGATATSDAFVQSLGSALASALN